MNDKFSDVWLRILGTRATIAELAAINTTILPDGALVYVTEANDYYALRKQSTAAADGLNIVAPATGSAGRWFMQQSGGAARELWGSQAAWFVDPANSTGLASDLNVGDTAANPLLTWRELSYRLSAPTLVRVAMTVTGMSDVPAPLDDPFFYRIDYDGSIGFPSAIDIRGTRATVDSATLTGVVNQDPATNTYATVTAAGFDWTPYIGMRVRRSGTEVVAWIDSVPGAVDTALINRPWDLDGFASASFGVGQTLLIESLTQMGPVGGVPLTRNWSDFVCNFFDVRVADNTYFSPGLSGWYGCDIPVGWWVAPDLSYYYGSHINVSGAHFLQARQAEVYGCLLESITLEHGRLVVAGDCLCSGKIICRGDLRQVANLGFIGWTTGALVVESGAAVGSTGALWGLSAAANTYGLQVFSGGYVDYTVLPNIIGALSPGQDVRVGSAPIAYASLPMINPANNAAIVLRAS